ncbi:MAG: disulfide bond formation protein B [Pseudomonadota bacterium]
MFYFCREAGPRQVETAFLAGLISILVILTVLIFQHGFGYIPCYMCYVQREPYYIAIPALILAFFAALKWWPACVSRGMLTIAFLCFVATALMGAYHSGVEWGFWMGPAECGLGVQSNTTNASDLLGNLGKTTAPLCNEAAGRFLGLSFAGWNVIAAAFLAWITSKGMLGDAY